MLVDMFTLENLCEYGEDILHANSADAYDLYATWEETTDAEGRRLCVFWARIQDIEETLR